MRTPRRGYDMPTSEVFTGLTTLVGEFYFAID